MEDAGLALVPRQATVRVVDGGSATITLEAAADRPVPPWDVSAFDMTGYQDRKQCVEVSLDRTKIAAGQTAKLTITVRKRSVRRLCVVGVVSTLGVDSHAWPVAVVMH